MYVCDLITQTYEAVKVITIAGPRDVYELLRERYSTRDRECFVVVLLTTKHTVLGIETVAVGTLNSAVVHPREVFKPAILQSAAAVVLAHNHPSGDPEPSSDDLAITQKLSEAGKVLGIEVLDHLIVAQTGYISLRSRKVIY